ncbi:hypothetical protein [Geodermatophilus siccatus]|uniref:hypothetical protein n=1 Tax=Geodermatophilus siccatus TaxID=1137991 RepID=UPI001113753A|nr:hypothetical protein [Geodermatophilus siccatus]
MAAHVGLPLRLLAAFVDRVGVGLEQRRERALPRPAGRQGRRLGRQPALDGAGDRRGGVLADVGQDLGACLVEGACGHGRPGGGQVGPATAGTARADRPAGRAALAT